MNQSYDYLVFIGRFQPFHRAHQGVVAQAFDRADKVILLLGSANRPRSVANPWSVAEREAMIRSLYDTAHNERLIIRGIDDEPYDDELWRTGVMAAVAEVTTEGANIGLIGHMKDSSSYYLRLFPDWGLESVANIDHINATDIRRFYFSLPAAAQFCYNDLGEPVIEALQRFRSSAAYQRLRAEYESLEAWRAQWRNAPYPPIFVTVDACVVCAGHVLLVQRKGPLGAGLWALPGGFLDEDETLADAALRELREETGLNCTAADIDHVVVFADPDRSARGRTITHAHRLTLNTDHLPAVNAADDAADAAWVALSALDSSMCFEDHYSIIRALTADAVSITPAR